MATKFKSDTCADKALVVVNLLVAYVITTMTTSYAFLPFRTLPKGTTGENMIIDEEKAMGNISEIALGESLHQDHCRTWHFKVLVYTSFGLGTLMAGVTSYVANPEKMLRIYCKLFILFNIIGVFVVGKQHVAHDIIWCLLGFTAFACHTCNFMHTVESVPGAWLVYVGVGLFGLGWTSGRLYSVLVEGFVGDWSTRLSLSAVVMFCAITAGEIFQPRVERINVSQETPRELISNPYGKRYLYCLAILWVVHGYVYYGISHQIYLSSIKGHVYECLTNSVANVLDVWLCVWTLQKRTVMGTLMVLSSFCCFALAVAQFVDGTTGVISTLSQVCSFLITSSFDILWLLSFEIIGRNVRYLTQGFLSFLARLGALSGAIMVHYNSFLHYPAAFFVGAFCVVGGIVAVFMLHEPIDPHNLTETTRTPKTKQAPQCVQLN